MLLKTGAECQNGSRQAFFSKMITSAMKTYENETTSATILFAERRQNNLRSKYLFRFLGKGAVSTGTDGKSTPRVKDYQRLVHAVASNPKKVRQVIVTKLNLKQDSEVLCVFKLSAFPRIYAVTYSYSHQHNVPDLQST